MKRLVICCLVAAQVVFANEPQKEDTVKTYQLGEFIVTALRGGGTILTLPMAADIITPKEFLHSRRAGLNDALAGIPGVLAQSRAGGQDLRLTIRGFGARGNGDRSNAATIRGVKVLIDGIPETEPDGRTSLDLIDLHSASRIEVLRTNASTLFGNASGGVINIETLPLFSSPSLEINNIFGSYGLRKNNVRILSPAGAGRFSLSASNSNFDGWRINSSATSTQFNGVFSSNLDETTKLKLVAGGAINTFQIPGALTQSQFDADPTQPNATYKIRNERRFNQVGRFGFSISKAFSENHSFEVVGFVAPKVLQRSERGTFRDFNRYHLGGGAVYQWTASQEGLLRRMTAGFDEAYQNGTILFYNLVNGERGDSLRTNKREGANTLGAFAQVEVRLLDDLSLTLGGRFDQQNYISEIFAAGAKQNTTNDNLTLDHFTPKAALLYRLNQYHSVYLNIGGGIEAPAFNEVDPPPTIANINLNPLLKPMTSTTIEIGMKGVKFFEGNALVRSLSYSVAAYTINVSNEIVPYNGGEWFFSAGESRRNGFEIGAQFDAPFGLSGLSLKSAFTYFDASYLTYANELGNFSNNKAPGIAPTMLNTRLRYTSESSFSAEISIEHLGAYYTDDANTAKVPSYVLLNANMGYGVHIGRVMMRGFLGVNNLTDERYAASGFINPVNVKIGTGTAPAYLEPGLPRNFFGGIDIHWEL